MHKTLERGLSRVRPLLHTAVRRMPLDTMVWLCDVLPQAVRLCLASYCDSVQTVHLRAVRVDSMCIAWLPACDISIYDCRGEHFKFVWFYN